MTRRNPTPPAPDRRAPWQIAQGNACGCRGQDDMCPCQNENPWPAPRIDWQARAQAAEARVGELEAHMRGLLHGLPDILATGDLVDEEGLIEAAWFMLTRPEVEAALSQPLRALGEEDSALAKSASEGLRPFASDSSQTSDWVLVPREPRAQQLADMMLHVVANEPGARDFAKVGAVLELLPPTGHPDARNVVADMIRDYRAMVSTAPAQEPPSPDNLNTGKD